MHTHVYNFLIKSGLVFLLLFLYLHEGHADPLNGPVQLKHRPVVFFALDPVRDWSIEAYARLGIFDVFDVFGLQDTAPDVSHNLIIEKAQRDGKVFLACMGLPFKGNSTKEMRENLIRYLEAPFKKKLSWNKQGLVFSGIKLDELSNVLREDESRGESNKKIDVLRDALKVFKKDYPDKLVYMWGVSQVKDKYTRVFREVIAPYVDFYIPEIYVRENEFDDVEFRILSCLSAFKKIDNVNRTDVSSKVIIGLGYFTAPETSVDNLSNKDFKVHMEKQLWVIQNHRYNQKKSGDCDMKRYGLAVYNPRLLKQDEIRWMVRLLNHYVVKGNSNWIGDGGPDQYPDLPLKNPSFEDTKDLRDPRFGWEYQAGTGGVISVQSNEEAGVVVPRGITTHGKVPQPARTAYNGNLFLSARVLTMKKGATINLVSQGVRLDPGKMYSLEAFIRYKNNSKSVVPGDVSIENATLILDERKFVPIIGKKVKLKQEVEYNWAQIYMVFKPDQPGIEIKLTDKNVPESVETVWDFIQLQPYYVDSPVVIGPIRDREVFINSDQVAQREVSIKVNAVSLKDTALVYTASGLPENAVFDSMEHRFTWKPTKKQLGRYPVTFIVSDGMNEAKEAVVIKVGLVNDEK